MPTSTDGEDLFDAVLRCFRRSADSWTIDGELASVLESAKSSADGRNLFGLIARLVELSRFLREDQDAPQAANDIDRVIAELAPIVTAKAVEDGKEGVR
jgi:hypothetical protein